MQSFVDPTDLIPEGAALAEAGDPSARSVLQRIVARDADAAKRERAQRLLDALEHA